MPDSAPQAAAFVRHVQPHGALLATGPGSRRISHASANLEEFLGLAAGAVLGRDIDELLGTAAVAALELSLGREGGASSDVLDLVLPAPAQPRLTAVVHRQRDRLIVELERARDGEPGGSMSQAPAVIASLRRAETVAQLCGTAVRQLRRLVGCDRVTIHRFDADGHNTVLAEDRAATLESYLDMRLPAARIPQRGGWPLVLQRMQAIPDALYRPVPLVAAGGSDPDDSPNLAASVLGGAARQRLDSMRRMGVRFELSVPLTRDGLPWGVIVCHCATPLAVDAGLRALCDVVGQLVSVLLLRVSETEELAERLRRHDRIASLRNGIEAAGEVAAGLRQRAPVLLDLMQATGALVRMGGSTSLIGDVPASEAAAAMVDAVRRRHRDEIVGIDDAGLPDGLAASHAAVASGILLMPITNGADDLIAWFRPEQIRTVRWGGDPPAASVAGGTAAGPVEPGLIQVGAGRSAPWTATDLQTARDFRRTVIGALLRQAEAQLAKLAAYDPLTGLANRRTVEAHLARWRLEARHPVAALLYLDIDRFKATNDTLGHAGGDEMLVQMAARLRRLAPPDSIAGRFGGDEFVIFWPGASLEEAERLAVVLVRELAEPVELDGHRRHVSASIGIAWATPEGPDVLLREADAVMFAAKRAGGGRAVSFQPALHAAVLTNMQTEQDLFRAIGGNQLEIHYQPLVSVPARLVFGFEALMRWRHPDRGWVSPTEFIPRAEEAGLITRLGDWVLSGAIRQIGIWRRLRPELTMSVNVSARQLTEGSLSTVLATILAAEGVPASAICIEVTESALMHEAAVRELQLLRNLGAAVAVDDFGTGYSSLSYLSRLPVDTVKIDRSFVTPLGSGSKADIFFCAIVDLAHTIDLHTIAEGCETESQWQIIVEAGCGGMQGWLAARAMDAAAIDRHLARPHGWSARAGDRPAGTSPAGAARLVV